MTALKRIWHLFYARNLEFLRDRDSMAWALVFPFLLLLGLYFVFGQNNTPPAVKVGISGRDQSTWVERFQKLSQVQVVPLSTPSEAQQKLAHHGVDLWLNTDVDPPQYHVSDTAPKGYLAERLTIYEWERRQQDTSQHTASFQRKSLPGDAEVPYLEWFFPGLLSMNLMFSAVFGVGYVIVRYRKNGVLKRLAATPVTAFEFLSAQVASRLFLIAFNTLILMGGGLLLFHFPVRGSALALVALFAVGSTSLIALGTLVSARTESEELANGLLNLMTFPMMLLSEVWFSLEGASPWMQRLAWYMPLTHLVKGARAIMNDGAGFQEIRPHLTVLALMTLFFLSVGASLFRWQKR